MTGQLTFRSLVLAGLASTSLAQADDRVILTANGSTLSHASGGGGGSLRWLHDFSPGTVVGAGFEYQTLADASWKFGSLNAAVTGGPEGRRWSLYGEVHRGSGDDTTHDFDYQVVAAGGSLPLSRRLSLQLEDRQIDVDRAHGNLPKLGLSMVWNPRLQITVSYANSVGGNLGTEIGTARVDYYIDRTRLIAGGAVGRADPVVVNLQGVTLPTRTLREAFVGFGRTFSRTEFLMLVDHLELGDSKRATLTLSLTLHLNRAAAPAR